MMKNIKAKTKWVIIRLLFFVFSSQSSRRFMPSISMQNEEVSAVKAPSALGNSADIKPITKMMEMAAGI